MAEIGILPPDERTELINGEILIMPPPGPRHGFVVDSLTDAFVRLAHGNVEKNPDASDIFLIIEVADSSLEQDTTVKMQLNAVMLVYSHPVGDSYQSIRELRRGDTLAPSLLPDCVIPVDFLLP